MIKQDLISTVNIESDAENKNNNASIQVGLSACLAGLKVRYNGGHTQSRLCLNILSKHFTFKTFCPEIAAGFSTPRPTMRLIGNPNAPKLVYSDKEEINLTEKLVNGFKNKLPEFEKLDGYILMKNSPSCGLERVKVYQSNGHPHQKPSMGLFAQALKQQYPLMPIEEEGRLNDDILYDNFVMRVYAYHNFRKSVLKKPNVLKLTQFHASYKYILMAHDQQKAKHLGRLIASHPEISLKKLIRNYFEVFMKTLSKPADKKNHANALLHISGYLKKSIPSAARQHIVTAIYKYKNGITPLSTPLTLLTHYLEQYGSRYINTQKYLQPYPENIHPIRKYCR